MAMFVASSVLADDDYRGAFVRVVSAPDCVDATNFVAEYGPAPVNVTYMRVQHIGDVGTPELAGEVANPISWDVGQFTGLSLPPAAFAQTQRGYRDIGPPEAASAFQLACTGARFYLDSRRFSHFLSASDAECRAVAERFPSFVLEDSAVMFVALLDPMTGACPGGTVPVHRLWNARAATNHRYTSDAGTRLAMLAAGWVNEGYGPQGVAMCSPDALAGTAAIR